MRIAKPILLTTRPLGVVSGVVEAYRFHPWPAVPMVVPIGAISIFIGHAERVIRRERAIESKNL